MRLSTEQVRHVRARCQSLLPGSRLNSARAIVRKLLALQAQEWASAQLAIHARSQEIAQADVIHAREVERDFILTWSLRGTLHLVPAEDLRWLLALCGEGAIRSTSRRYQQLGLTEAVREEALSAIHSILESKGALTRPELALALAERGIPVEGQAIHHLVRFAALRGLVCHGPECAGKLTFVLLADWLPDSAPAPADPLAELARRYLIACAPATLADFARWSGLTVAQVKAAWAAVADDCVPVSFPGGEALMLLEQVTQLEAKPEQPTLRLLPRYDNYLLGYASRAFMVADAHAKRVHPGGGLIRSCVLIDGEARANWKLEKRGKRQRILVEPFEALNAEHLALLEGEVSALGRFLNVDLELRVAGD